MSKISACPCKECGDRFVGCHSSCEGYKAWRKAKDEMNHKDFVERYNNGYTRPYREKFRKKYER